MTQACHPPEEEYRLKELLDLDILDSEPEQVFDDFTWLAKEIAQVPICLISLVDSERQWFKSRQGLTVIQTPRDVSFCTHAITKEAPLVVEDAENDQRFCGNPLVTGDPNIRFYLGIPLKTKRGFRIGTLCLIDRVPRKLDDKTVEQIKVIARRIMHEIESRRLRKRQRRLIEEDLGTKSLNMETADSLFPCIRQPLAALLDSTNYMLEVDEMSPEAKDNLLSVHRTARQVFEYFDTMLLDPKSGCFVTKSKPEPTPFRSMIHDTLELFRVALKQRQIRLDLNVSPKIPEMLQLDPLAFKQILMVLMDEALASLPGHIELNFDIPAKFQEPCLLTAVIRSQPSIEEANCNGVKAPSFLHPTWQNRLRELKVGFLKKRIRSMGGHLMDYMASNHEITVMMPVMEVQAHHTSEETWLNLNVLYLNNDPIAEVMMTRYLSQLHHAAVVTSNPEKLFSTFLDQKFDCVLLDSSIDVFVLSSVVQKLQMLQGERKSKVPLVGLASDGAKQEALQKLGIQDVISKPLNIQKLQNVLFSVAV